MVPTGRSRAKVIPPWWRRMNWPLVGGISVALLLNGAFFYWLMIQPMPAMCYEIADNLRWYFKVKPQPVPPFQVVDITNERGELIEKGFVVPTKVIPKERLPYPSTNRVEKSVKKKKKEVRKEKD